MLSTIKPRSLLRLFRRRTICSQSHRSRLVASDLKHPLEEALLPSAQLKAFFPAHPGQVLDDRFKVIAKIGFGGASTVWLAENLQYREEEESLIPRFVSIKIPSLRNDATKEVEYLKLISNANRSHDGLAFIRIPVDEFHLKGPEGTHHCLVYEPMRETLVDFQHQMREQKLSLPLFKFFVYCLLHALDYLHTECQLIHTDIKDDNIMITIENEKVLEEFAYFHTQKPQPKYTQSDGRSIYLSRNNFGPIQDGPLLPMLGDFNLSFPGQDYLHHVAPIQSHRYRAPEVLLGCPWSYSVDIWNFGLMLWNLLEDVSLFDRPAGKDGEYDAHVHLSQMVSLLGEPPLEVVERERKYRAYKLKKPVLNFQNKECWTMNEFWGGPFFDRQNQIMRKDLIVQERRLADTVTTLSGEEKELFLDFVTGMIEWLPEKRKTAKELLEHPFFDSFHRDGGKTVKGSTA